MKRVLCIVGSMSTGGAETFLMKLYRSLDREQYQMDFCVAKDGIYDEEIYSLGGKIFYTVPKTLGLFKSYKTIKKIVQTNQYKYVMRISQHSLSALELIAAKQAGAKTIFRSSNTRCCGSKVNALIHKICMPLSKYVPDVKIAPSTEAAEFMFGKKCIAKKKAQILHNAVDIDVIRFDEADRKQIRSEFDLQDTFVVGHIGRFNLQKNHLFLLDIFKQIKNKKQNAVLLLVGTGELEETIKERARDLGIEDSIIYTGVRKDISKLLSAMDVFVFPSFFEGMPNTVIEAQATGLPCFVADTITQEAKITNLVSYLSLNESAETWANQILKTSFGKRKDTRQEFIHAKYDIDSVIQEFQRLVFEEI